MIGTMWVTYGNQALKLDIIVHVGEPKPTHRSFAQIPLNKKVITTTKLYLILAYYTVISIQIPLWQGRLSITIATIITTRLLKPMTPPIIASTTYVDLPLCCFKAPVSVKGIQQNS